MAEYQVIEVEDADDFMLAECLKQAAELAETEHRMTFLVRNGTRIGAIVPVGVAVAMEPGELRLGEPPASSAPAG